MATHRQPSWLMIIPMAAGYSIGWSLVLAFGSGHLALTAPGIVLFTLGIVLLAGKLWLNRAWNRAQRGCLPRAHPAWRSWERKRLEQLDREMESWLHGEHSGRDGET
jgi:hypothetical protein